MIKTWFNYSHQLQSYVMDLVLAELSTLRQGLQTPIFSVAKMTLDESGLNADSLEMMALSIALSRSIHLENSEIDDNLFNKTLLDDWIAISLKSLSQSSAHISFKSSGSVGLKKYHTHSLALLEQEAEYLGQLLKGRKRILRAVPSHHIYGFIFTVLLPRYLGDSVEVIDMRGLSFNIIQALLQPGDLMIAYPEFWQF
jgi:long-chain acyl-CoA synthetase